MSLEIGPLVRVEGHVKVEISLDPRELRCTSVKVKAIEGARLFEYVLRGKKWSEVPIIASRICGVCGYAHAICAAKVVEDALGIEVNDDVMKLRELALRLNTIDSHLLHIIVFTIPDIYGKPHILGVEDIKDVIKKLILLRRDVGLVISKLFGDRVHIRNIIPGGFANAPNISLVRNEINKLVKFGCDVIKEFCSKVSSNYSTYSSILDNYKTNYAALRSTKTSYLVDGELMINNVLKISKYMYRRYFIEVTKPYTTSRHTLLYGYETFMVGALSRLNTNVDIMPSEVKELIKLVGLKLPSTNPLNITLAQAVEVYLLLNTLEELIQGIRAERAVSSRSLRIRRGHGFAYVEAPRGLLYYSLSLNDEGYVVDADVVTPTAQNMADMEVSISAAVNNYIQSIGGINYDGVKKITESVVRGYDPCVSCAVHVVIKD